MTAQTRAWTRAARHVLAVLCATVAGLASAAIIKVPADRPTIQAAIDSASTGDDVWVLKGTYKENLTLKPKVRLEGGWGPNYAARSGPPGHR